MSKSIHKRWLDVERVALALDAIRAHRGLSWRGVAREAGVDPSVLHRLTSGGIAISADNLVALFAWAGIADVRPYLLLERRQELGLDTQAEDEGVS